MTFTGALTKTNPFARMPLFDNSRTAYRKEKRMDGFRCEECGEQTEPSLISNQTFCRGCGVLVARRCPHSDCREWHTIELCRCPETNEVLDPAELEREHGEMINQQAALLKEKWQKSSGRASINLYDRIPWAVIIFIVLAMCILCTGTSRFGAWLYILWMCATLMVMTAFALAGKAMQKSCVDFLGSEGIDVGQLGDGKPVGIGNPKFGARIWRLAAKNQNDASVLLRSCEPNPELLLRQAEESRGDGALLVRPCSE